MARRSADEWARLTVRVPRGHQGFWRIIRELQRERRGWTIPEVDARSAVARQTIADYVRRLVKAGIAEVAGETGERGGNLAKVYRLVYDPGPEAPRLRRDGSEVRQGLGQERLWRAIKMLGEFSWRDLVATASVEGEPVPAATAQSYVKHLARAGYLITVVPAQPPKRPARYRLKPSMNSGPLAPQIQRTDWVWDPNLQKVVGPEAEERPA